MLKLDIQKFGGRGATSGGTRSRGTGSGFLGEEKGGAILKNITGGEVRWFAGDIVTRQSDGKEFKITEAKGNKIELYSGDETIHTSEAIGYQFKERGNIGQRILAKQRTNVLRGADDRTNINGKSVAMYNKAPKGFIKTSGATTAPKGYEWYSNNKSLFGDERINILVKKKK